MTKPKLTAIHLVQENVYLIKIDYYGVAKYEVSGIRIPENQSQFTVSSLDEIFLIKTLPKQILHYSDNNGNQITVEGYNDTLDQLKEKGRDDGEGYGDLIFDNLDDEYAYKKFKKTWTPVLGPEEIEKIPVEVEVVEVRTDSGDPDIVSVWNSPTVKANAALYEFNRRSFARKCFISYCDEYKLKHHIPTYSGLRYAQVNGNYLFDNDFIFERPFIGTLEQCKKAKDGLDREIKIRLLPYDEKIKEVKSKNIIGILNELRTIRSRVSSVEPIKKSSDNHRTALVDINKLISELEDELLSNAQ
jgi:hypothetical protein